MRDIIEQRQRRANRAVLVFAPIAIAAMIAGLIVQSGDDAESPTTHSVAASSLPFDIGAWIADAERAVHKAVVAQRRTCSQQYDYPGCSPAQQNSLENPDRDTFRGNYDKGRWGQGDHGVPVRNLWDNLTNANNDKMRRMYNDAVQRFGPQQAEYQTWAGFKNNMQCGGNFGAYSGLVEAWCLTQKPINWLVEQIDKIIMDCQGLVIDGLVTGGVLAKVKLIATTVKVGSMGGAAVAAIGCAISFIRQAIESIFSKRKTAEQAVGAIRFGT